MKDDVPLAGVIGLTTAIVIQEKGHYKVTIVSELLPSDPKSTKYTSHWAVRGNLEWLHNAERLQ